jgi:hypothetical protein
MNDFEATKKLGDWEAVVCPVTHQPICALTTAYLDHFLKE